MKCGKKMFTNPQTLTHTQNGNLREEMEESNAFAHFFTIVLVIFAHQIDGFYPIYIDLDVREIKKVSMFEWELFGFRSFFGLLLLSSSLLLCVTVTDFIAHSNIDSTNDQSIESIVLSSFISFWPYSTILKWWKERMK